MHLNDEQIQRLMHGELDAHARESVSRHAAECLDCARALATAMREENDIFDLLEHVDHDAPIVDAARFATPPREGSPVWVRRVAGIVVVAALAGAAYAIPGSPLPTLVKKLAAIMTGERATPPAADDVSIPGAPVTSGIAVAAGDEFVIQFAGAQESGEATIRLTDDTFVRVRVINGTAAFTTDAGRLHVENRGSAADYQIELPRATGRIEIRVASSVVWQGHDGHVITDAAPDSTGLYHLPLQLHDQ